MAENNIIPVKEELTDQFKPEIKAVDLEEYINTIFNSIELEDTEEELRRYKKWQKNRAFYRGNQRGFWDAKKRTWVTVDLDSLSPSEASVLVINNQFRPQVKTLSKEFSRSQTRVRANAKSDSQVSLLTGRFSDALIRYYQPKLMPESKRQIEAKYLLLCGNSFRYTRYNKEKTSSKVLKPILGTKTLPEYNVSMCPECGYRDEGVVDSCPKCNSLMENTTVPALEMNDVVTGYTKVNSGDPDTEVVDPTQIKVWAGATSGDLPSSPYIRRRRFVKEEFITEIFPFYTPTENSKLSDSAQAQWQFMDTSSSKESANTVKGLYEYTQLWLAPSYYSRKKLEKDIKFKKLIDGKYVDFTILKGTILIDKFPTGMYVCKVGKDILGYYPENKDELWLHTPFDINIDGFWADGLEDSVMNQQIINEYTSLSVENVLYNASPKLVINPNLINPVTVTGRPKDMILMSDNARKDSEPKQGFAQIQGMSLTQEVMAGIESAKRDMREQTGALLGFNGQGDPNITTATGMSIARDSALALVSTPLAIRAETDEAWCWQIISIVKKYWHDQKYKFLLGKYNEAEAEAFKNSNIEEAINLYVEPNSWMPLTNLEKIQNLGAYMSAFGLPLGFLNPQVPEVLRQYASQLYMIPVDLDELAPDIRIAQKRLDIAKEIAAIQIPKAMQLGQITAMAGKPKVGETIFNEVATLISDSMGIEEDIDEHEVFISEYRKWLKTDEGQNANPILRQAVKKTMADHTAFMQTQQASDAAHNLALNAGQPPPPQQSQQWQQQDNADSPMTPPTVNRGIQDYSSNAKLSNK